VRTEGEKAGWGLRAAAFAALAFLHLPLLVIVLYAFTIEDRVYVFPPPGYTLHWFSDAFARTELWQALGLSLGVACCATALALVLGSLAAFALARARFFGRDALTVLFVLPIALPGIVSGIALLAALRQAGIELGFWTIVAGHATFCLVIVYNNVVGRLRRMPVNLAEASMDLGATGLQTLRYVLLPQLAGALVAGAMLAFALSFDEIIVTLFTAGHERTLPIWIYDQMFRPRERPLTNVAALIVIAITLLPVLLANRLTRADD
jgi:putative spermidine/putrescine transport system permease protein